MRARRQVSDRPPVRLVVPEHQAPPVQGPTCRAVSGGAFASEAPSRAPDGPHVRALAVYLVEERVVPRGRVPAPLSDLFAGRVGRGTLVAWVQRAAPVLAPVEERITAALRAAPVVPVDETGVRQSGRRAGAHVTSTPRVPHDASHVKPRDATPATRRDASHAKRGTAATDALGILPAVRGARGRDGWARDPTDTACRQARCTGHHLRALTVLEEEAHQTGAQELTELRLALRAAADPARGRGGRGTARCWPKDAGPIHRPIPRGAPDSVAAANKPPPAIYSSAARCTRTRCSPSSTISRSRARTIRRSATGAPSRSSKRSPGAFAAIRGAVADARMRGSLATMRQQGRALFATLDAVFAGHPLAPEFA